MRLNRNSTATVPQQYRHSTATVPQPYRNSGVRRRGGGPLDAIDPRAAASRDAGARATRPGEPAYPREAVLGGNGASGAGEPTAEDQAARTTQGARTPRQAATCAETCQAGTGSGPRGVEPGPDHHLPIRSTPSHQDPRNLDSWASMAEWGWTTPHCDISTTVTEAAARGGFQAADSESDESSVARSDEVTMHPRSNVEAVAYKWSRRGAKHLVHY